jgi:hypothetical protein
MRRVRERLCCVPCICHGRGLVSAAVGEVRSEGGRGRRVDAQAQGTGPTGCPARKQTEREDVCSTQACPVSPLRSRASGVCVSLPLCPSPSVSIPRTPSETPHTEGNRPTHRHTSPMCSNLPSPPLPPCVSSPLLPVLSLPLPLLSPFPSPLNSPRALAAAPSDDGTSTEHSTRTEDRRRYAATQSFGGADARWNAGESTRNRVSTFRSNTPTAFQGPSITRRK